MSGSFPEYGPSLAAADRIRPAIVLGNEVADNVAIPPIPWNRIMAIHTTDTGISETPDVGLFYAPGRHR